MIRKPFIALVSFFAVVSSFFVLPIAKANAATIIKANNTISLSVGTSWVGGVAPSTLDVAQWNSTVSGSNMVTLGSPVYFGEISIQNPGGLVTISNDSNTLGLAGIGGTGIDMSSATQNLTLNCPVLLGNSQTWNVASARTLSVSGVISAASGLGLTIAGSGTTLLSGSNSYNGGTIVAGGTLKAGGLNCFGPNGSSVTVQSGATLDINGQQLSSYTFPSSYYTVSVSGSGANGNGAIQNNSPTASYMSGVTLTGDTSFGGTTNWTMIVPFLGAPTFSGNGYNLTKVGSNEIDFGGSLNANWTVAGLQNLNVNSGTLGVLGAYYTTSIDNTQLGSIFINSGGVFRVGSTAAAGVVPGVSILKPIVMSGGTLQTSFTDVGHAASGTATIAAAISLNSTGVLALQSSSSLVLNGVLSDGSSANGIILTMLGTGSPGTLVLNASNTYSGNTIINQGTLQFGNSGSIPSGSGKGNVNLASGATLDLNGQNGAVNGVFGTGTINNTSAAIAALNLGNNNATSTFSGIIENTGGRLNIVKSGTGTTTLGGPGLYGGSTTISAGTLAIGPGGSLSNTVVNVLGNATFALALNGSGNTAASGNGLSLASNSTLRLLDGFTNTMYIGGGGTLAGATLNFDLGASSSDLLALGGGANMSGTNFISVSALGSILKSGSGAAGYTLVTAVSGGLNPSDFALSASTLMVAGQLYNLSLQGNSTAEYLDVSSNSGTIATTYNLAAATASALLHSGGTTTVTATIINAGTGQADTLNYSGLNLNFTGGSLSGTGLPKSGGPLAQQASNSGSVTFIASTPGIAVLTPVVSGGTNATLATAASLGTITSGTISVYSGQSMWSTSGGGTWGTLASNFGANWSANNGSPGLDPGFKSSDTATFATAVASGTVSVTLDGASPSLAALTFSNTSASYTIAQGTGGTLSLSAGTNSVPVNVSGSQAITAPLILNSTALVTTSKNTYLLSIGSNISGSGGLAKSGSGALFLQGNNSYSGGTTISGGILQLGSSGALPLNTALAVNGGQLDLNTFSSAVDSLNGGGTIGSIAGGAPLFKVGNAGGSGTFSGAIGGPIALIKSGSGLQVLSGSNTYSGGTTVSAGTLQGNSASLQGNIVNNAAVVFNQTASGTYAGSMTGSGSLTLIGASQLTLAGADTFSSSGGIAVNQGTLAAPYGISHGGSAITIASGALLQAGGQVYRAVSGSGSLTATAELLIGNAAQTGQFNMGGAPGVGGTLNSGSNAIVILSADKAILGSQTNLGPGGSLTTLNGAQLGNASSVDSTKALTATGNATINSSFINNGIVNGPTGVGQELIFTQAVKGAGATTGNVAYFASYLPSNSPDVVSVQNVRFDPTNTLIMELFDVGPGSGYDQLDISGQAILGGTLDVQLMDGFAPSAGESFELLSGSTTGSFAQLDLPALGSGLGWDTSNLYTTGAISVTPEPGTFALLAIAAVGLLVTGWRRRDKIAFRARAK